jgi:hypothetical protein
MKFVPYGPLQRPPLVRNGAQNFAGGGGDWNTLYGPKAATPTGVMPSIPTLPSTVPNSGYLRPQNDDNYGSSTPATDTNLGVPNLSNLGNIGDALNTAGQVNRFNQDYYQGAEAADPLSSSVRQLLDPNFGAYDSRMHGAELATARGVPGSGLADQTMGRVRANDVRTNLALANSIQSGVHSRVPQPFDVSSQLITPYQQGQLTLQQGDLTLRQAQLALQDRIQSGQLKLSQDELMLKDKIQNGELSLAQAKLVLETKVADHQISIQDAQLLLGWYQATSQIRGGGGGGGGNRGGGGFAPLPGAGGGAPSEYNPRNGPAFQSYNPLQLPGYGPRGASSATAPAPIVAPDNWDMLTPQQQQDYALQYRGNPANYGQDPWAAEEGDYTVSDYGPVDEWDDWYD